ncbi:hypothetical protein [Candidatus Ferrigenium straubiae]|jgi:cell division protein ZapA (FtsZ GTPase activity inhibitor)|uniref:hypothetical protein n=1 Tax=Candidatus Ferrigenium straubiae TaxID=2919506 RepID=UPI003F4AD867
MGDNNNEVNNAQVMHSLGQLTGAVHAMQQGLTARIEDIRSDIRRAEEAQSDRMDRIEDSLGQRIENVEANVGQRITDLSETINQRIDGLGGRVTNLEAEDKKIIEKVAKMSALGGGVGGALVTAVVELIKHTTK